MATDDTAPRSALPGRIADEDLPALRGAPPRRPLLGEAICAVLGMQYDASLDEDLLARRWEADRPDVLARRLERPVQPAADPREAWEILATQELVPESWIADPRRAFTGPCRRCHRTQEHWWQRSPCAACESVHDRYEHPPHVRIAVAIASDPRGVATAEELARAVAAGLAPFASVGARIVWKSVPVRSYPPSLRERVQARAPALAEVLEQSLPFEPAFRQLQTLLGEAARAGRVPPSVSYGGPASDALVLRAQFRAAERLGRPEVAACANPFAPALELFVHGYALDDFDGNEIVLRLPML